MLWLYVAIALICGVGAMFCLNCAANSDELYKH